MQLRRFLYTFIPPLICVLSWFIYENNELGFPNFQLKAGYYDPKQLEEIIGNIPIKIEEERESATPLKFPVDKKPFDISTALGQTIVDKLGYFANLPIHRACLINLNRVTSEGTPMDPKNLKIGAIGIVPKTNKSLNFYAEIWKREDCKSVFKKDFENEKFSPPEYAYPIFKEIGPEDMKRVLRGEPYKIYLREVFINASDSRFILRLNYYIVFSAYLILTLAWSLIYFQIRKMIYHIRGKKDSVFC